MNKEILTSGHPRFREFCEQLEKAVYPNGVENPPAINPEEKYGRTIQTLNQMGGFDVDATIEWFHDNTYGYGEDDSGVLATARLELARVNKKPTDADIEKLSSDAFMWADYAFDHLFTADHKQRLGLPEPHPAARQPEEDAFIEMLMVDYVFPNVSPEERKIIADLQHKRLLIRFRCPEPAIEQEFCALRDNYRESIKSQLTDLQRLYVEKRILAFGDGD